MIAAVGVVLGVVALFGTRKVLAGVGVALCVAGIAFTVAAQGAAVEEFDTSFGGGPDAMADVTVSDCQIVDDGYGFLSAQGIVAITNSTAETQSYFVTVSVNDETGARISEINAITNALAAGQSVTLSGTDASGMVNESSSLGPVQCQVADVDPVRELITTTPSAPDWPSSSP